MEETDEGINSFIRARQNSISNGKKIRKLVKDIIDIIVQKEIKRFIEIIDIDIYIIPDLRNIVVDYLQDEFDEYKNYVYKYFERSLM